MQCTSSSCSGSCISGLPARLMEETSCCGTSFAVDCTLSLGSATSRPDIPARLSRAGSPEQGQDLAWPRSSSVRSEQTDPSMRRTCDQEKSEQGISWNGSCGRSDPNGLPEDYPPVRTNNQPTITYLCPPSQAMAVSCVDHFAWYFPWITLDDDDGL